MQDANLDMLGNPLPEIRWQGTTEFCPASYSAYLRYETSVRVGNARSVLVYLEISTPNMLV